MYKTNDENNRTAKEHPHTMNHKEIANSQYN